MANGTNAPGWAQRLAKAIEGTLLTDAFSRARYATDASAYQCVPQAVCLPKTAADVAAAVSIAREEGLSVTARGGGTSTAGQALGEGLIIDFSQHLNRFLFLDETAGTCAVEPGISPETVNRRLRGKRLWFPVDIASGGQACIGGMLGNNAVGTRALRYGRMGDNVLAVDAVFADGSTAAFAEIGGRDEREPEFLPGPLLDLLQFAEMQEPKLVTLWGGSGPLPAGPDLRALLPGEGSRPLARFLAGSEGALAIATRIELKLARRPRNRALGICRFKSLRAALACVPQIVALGATAIELMDYAMLAIAREEHSPLRLEPHIIRTLYGEPAAVLLVEFAEANPVENSRLLKALDEVTQAPASQRMPFVEVMGTRAQAAAWAFLRRAIERGMALRNGSEPVTFLEDCAVPLRHLPDFANALSDLVSAHGTVTAIHGHAGLGCLHVRPMLDLRAVDDRRRLRALAEDLLSLLRKYDGRIGTAYGLGLARHELAQRNEPQAMEVLAGLKAFLDPRNILNPGKIFGAPRFDDPALLRHALNGQQTVPLTLAWGNGEASPDFFRHAERCRGLAICRKAESPSACPSWRVTREEKDSPRGRANAIRHALAGQLGERALGSPKMVETMRLCLSCKACRTSCPNGIDIPKMKAEVLAAARRNMRFSPAEEFCARLPFHTDRARRWRFALRLRDLLPGLPRLSETRLGFAADRPWPHWRGGRLRLPLLSDPGLTEGRPIVGLFDDCFNRSFEPGTLEAAARLLEAAGYQPVRVASVEGSGNGKVPPLCCGRTLYDGGLIGEAKEAARRLLQALEPFASAGHPVIGLEPACALMLRDEYAALGLPADRAQMLTFDEFILAERAEGRFKLPLKPVESQLLFHAHCHQHALGLNIAALEVLKLIPGLAVQEAPPTCCGLNGSFGYTADTFEISLSMAELGLFPAIRRAGRDALVAAAGFSCRKQIRDGLGRPASHPAIFLLLSLNALGEAGASNEELR